MRLRTLAACLLLTTAGLAAATVIRPVALQAYLAELAAVEQAQGPASMEPLLAAAEAAQDALMQLEDGDRAWIEVVDEPGFAALQQELRGLRLARGYDVYAQPDPAFLRQLADRQGRPEDLVFFRLYERYWSAEMLPQYLSMGTRPTPCVRFGEGVLPQLYAEWQDFAARYPGAYVAFTRQTLRDLEEAVALGVCACGDEASVTGELRGFLKRFPASPVSPQVRMRLRELRETPDLRPVRCR
jgi:hypothetical protein